MADFEFGTEKRLSRLTLGRAEVLNARFLEVANASATKLDKTGGSVTGGLSITGNFSTSGTFSATGNATIGGNLSAAGSVALGPTSVSGDLAMGANAITGVKDPVNNQDAATKVWVLAQIASILDGAPGALDTLNELAAAMGDDPNFAATMTTALAGKLSLSGGSMTGSLDFNNQFGVNVPTPTQSHHIAPRSYVDAVVGSIADAEAAALSAAGSATAAAASFDAFDDRYLGAKTSDPTVDNDGNALITGALYFNSSAGNMRVYDGTAWVVIDVPDVASSSEARAGTANKLIDAAVAYTAREPVTLVDDATITPDFDAGRNFTVTLGGNRTLANPTNQAAGQSGYIRVIQDATGGRTLSHGTNWEFAGGAPTLSTAANAVDVIAYEVFANGVILATFAGEFS